MKHSSMLALVALISACGSDGGSSGKGGPGGATQAETDGQVTSPWTDQCVVTFTQDFSALDDFGDTALAAKKGQKFLVSTFGTFNSDAGVTILYLTSTGPAPIEIDVKDGDPAPFTSNCSDGASTSKLGVFQDATVYSDAKLTKELCKLTAGSSEVSGGFSYNLASDNIDLTASSAPYAVDFGGPLQLCNGASSGYVEAKSVSIEGTDVTVLPFDTFLAPKSN